MDELLATHFAHLFIRDPIVVFNEDLQHLDLDRTDHFENLQSTNWQHMRFKPPPHDKDTGWRVEFRPMEIQMTDFENAAFSIFMVLISRAILSFDLNFYVPIRKVSENMETAHARNAVGERMFYFRKQPLPTVRHHRHAPAAVNGHGSGTWTPQHGTPSRPASPRAGPVEDEYELMTIDEIINGQTVQGRARRRRRRRRRSTDDDDDDDNNNEDKDDNNPSPDPSSSSTTLFPGLLPLVETYLNSVNIEVETRCELARYLDLIRRRAAGRSPTAASWIRHFITSHPDYRRDSVVSERVCWDLVRAVERVSSGQEEHNGCGDGDGDGGGEVV